MKTIRNLILLAMILSSSDLKPQANRCATTQTQTPVLGCLTSPYTQYYPNDTIKIYLNFIMAKPTAGSGIYDTTQQSNAQSMVNQMNQNMLNLQPPNLPLTPPAPYVSNSKIKFVLKSFKFITSNVLYNQAPNMNIVPLDKRGLNIIYGANSNTANVGYGIADGVPSKQLFVINSPYVPCNINASPQTVNLLLHEITHSLGLAHTYINDTSYYYPRFVNDYRAEPASIFSVSTGTAGCGVPNSSSNIQGYNWDCRNYLSPKQIGLMHYYIQNGDITSLTNLCDYDAAKSVTITTSQTWTLSRVITGDLIIKPNNTLTIKCKVSLPSGAKVVVEKGAMLIIDGGEVTNSCGNTFDGIEVAGDVNNDQSFNSTTGYAYNQGILKVINGGTVSHAGTAVRNYATTSTHQIIWNSIGGMIWAKDANFVNNARSVEFISYPNYSSNSHFRNCKFVINDSINGGQVPYSQVTLWDVTGVKFWGCKFEFGPLSSVYNSAFYGSGIESIDASYVVDQYCAGANCIPSEFNYLKEGIKVLNANPLRSIIVRNSSFYWDLRDAVYLQNMNTFLADNNNIIVYPSLGTSNGMYLNNCKYYTIKNRTYQTQSSMLAPTGIFLHNSREGAHSVYHNTMTGLKVAISSVGNNSGDTNNVDGLKMNCNNFGTGSSRNKYDISMVRGTLLDNPSVKKLRDQ